MRRARWLVLILIVAIVGAIAVIFQAQKTAQTRNAPKAPPRLPDQMSARANDWTWEQTRDGRPIVRVWARDFNQNAEGNRIELQGVTLHLFHKDGKAFDKVKSEKADFDLPNGMLFSEGEVDITMGVATPPAGKAPVAEAPEDELAGNRLVHIKTSGVHFESKTGKAWTERAATFGFDRGEGQSVGAQYDPASRELLMHHDVKMTWRGVNPKAKPIEIAGGSLAYKEAESKVFLTPWSKFRRDTLSMEGAGSVVFLKEGRIETVEAAQAKGVDTRPDRKTEYAADQLNLYFNEEGQLKNVAGVGNAKLVSTSAAAKTDVTSGRIDLDFVSGKEDSELRKALATTNAVVRSAPVLRPKVQPSETRIIRSNVVELFMREGGKEMERAQTQAPGEIEFLPNRAGQKHRTVKGDSMVVDYGPANQIKAFTATQVSTRTDNEPLRGKPQPPAFTWSNGMAANFDAKTGNMTVLEQWDQFRYEEGDRKANADRAELHQAEEQIRLLGSARVWDATGSTTADAINLAQKTGDFEAIGNVTSTRQQEKKKDPKASGGTGMLTGDDPVQARAGKMTSSQDNTLITYTGNAVLWQGSNRINADVIRIDSKANRLEATGNVISQLIDNSESKRAEATPATADAAAKKKKAKAPVFTNVRAPEMTYDDKTRLAHYRGGSQLVRGGMTVTAKEIRAWLREGEDSSLDRSFADGGVKIVQVSPERTRTGTAEHSEYYADQGKMILQEGQPEFVDSVKGTTRGSRITYFTTDDRMLVEGEEKVPVRTKIIKRPSTKKK